MAAPTAHPETPLDAFRREARLRVIDMQIQARHRLFLDAITAGEIEAAKARMAERDAVLDERYAFAPVDRD